MWVTTQSAHAVVCCITQSSQEITMGPRMTKGCHPQLVAYRPTDQAIIAQVAMALLTLVQYPYVT